MDDLFAVSLADQVFSTTIASRTTTDNSGCMITVISLWTARQKLSEIGFHRGFWHCRWTILQDSFRLTKVTHTTSNAGS